MTSWSDASSIKSHPAFVIFSLTNQKVQWSNQYWSLGVVSPGDHRQTEGESYGAGHNQDSGVSACGGGGSCRTSGSNEPCGGTESILDSGRDRVQACPSHNDQLQEVKKRRHRFHHVARTCLR